MSLPAHALRCRILGCHADLVILGRVGVPNEGGRWPPETTGLNRSAISKRVEREASKGRSGPVPYLPRHDGCLGREVVGVYESVPLTGGVSGTSQTAPTAPCSGRATTASRKAATTHPP